VIVNWGSLWPWSETVGEKAECTGTVDAGVLFLTMVILELLHIEQKVGVMWYKVSSLGTRETIK